MTMLPAGQGFNWSNFAGGALSGLGQGLMAAGSPQGWSAFGPAFSGGIQGFRQNQALQQQMAQAKQAADRDQARFEAEQRTANQDAAERARLAQQWQQFLGDGLMSPQSDAAQPGVTTASGIDIEPGLMQAAPRYVGGSGSDSSHFQQTNPPPSVGAAAPAPVSTDDQGFPGVHRNGLQLSPTQRQLLALMPPEQGMKQYAEWAMAGEKDNRTSDEQNYEYAKGQGYKGSFMDFQTELKRSGRSQNIVNMPGPATPDERGRGAFAEANAKAQAQYFDDVAKAGAQANQRLGDINQLTSLIELTPQGAGQDWINKGAAVLSRFGIDPGEFTNVPAAQAFQSIVSRVAPTLRVTGNGATSDFETNQFLASLPAIGNMPDGNRIIANNLKKISERSVQEAYIANQVQGGDLTPAQGRKKILDLGPLNLDLPTFGGAPQGGPGGAPGTNDPVASPTIDDPLGILGQ